MTDHEWDIWRTCAVEAFKHGVTRGKQHSATLEELAQWCCNAARYMVVKMRSSMESLDIDEQRRKDREERDVNWEKRSKAYGAWRGAHEHDEDIMDRPAECVLKNWKATNQDIDSRETFWEFLKLSDEDLLYRPGVGKATLRAVRKELADLGYGPKEDPLTAEAEAG